ncbi:hypothetical protein AGMMS49982_08710 [Bacteroidia bacterium]|nr:hypothetical protein AGMMS49982_08710 [Bacteroidia bacterium]
MTRTRYLVDTHIAIFLIEHHDPNDHMLISQAITEKMCMVSSDKQFRNYSDKQFDLFFNHR